MSAILNEATVTETNPAAEPSNGQGGEVGSEGAARCAPTTETQPAATPVGARRAAPETPLPEGRGASASEPSRDEVQRTSSHSAKQPGEGIPQPVPTPEEAYPLAERQRRLRAAIEKIEAKSLEILERRLDGILARQRKEPEMKLTNADLQTVKLVRVVVRVLAMTVGVHVPLVPPKTPAGPRSGEGVMNRAPTAVQPQPARARNKITG